MCRWMAYSGSPVLLADLLLRPKHSLIDQSLHSRMGAETTNGDGFGLGWYGVGDTPGTFHSTEPAWNDRNLADLARHLESAMFLAHVRAATGGPIQRTNCHPFRHDNWLFVHNGLISDFAAVRRDLMMAVEPALFSRIEGSTDSEVFFYLALTFGLRDDPVPAIERAVGLIEDTGHAHGISDPSQMTVATADGDSLWAVRYSSAGQSRSLFHSTDVATLRAQHPDLPGLARVDERARLIVSEPLVDLAGAWAEVPEATSVTIRAGSEQLRPFVPRRA